MKIFNVSQIREADNYTVVNEPISSLNLMERASTAFVRWFCDQFVNTRPVAIFSGKGNNGGDGLVIARLLCNRGYQVKVYVIVHSVNESADFRENLTRLKNHTTPSEINQIDDFPHFSANTIIVDAIFGSGLSRPATGVVAEVITALNNTTNKIISVDIASGLYADKTNDKKDVIIKPHCTVSFQFPKLAFMLPQNADFVGSWHVVDIGLHPQYISNTSTPYHYTDQPAAERLIIPRAKFSHKGTFGHALLVAGSFGKMGAAVLAGKACLRSGVGLLTMYIPACGYDIMQISLPEAMTTVDPNLKYLSELPDISTYSAIGIGPGLGQEKSASIVLQKLLNTAKAGLVIDADALNLLASNQDLPDLLPKGTILTPHPKEFQRLAGESTDEFHRLEVARDFARKHQVILCLKGANTAVILSNGDVHFNSTGNAGMATGGTGDVLTGIITALLAQGYSPEHAAILGVYQHGLAGDRAAEKKGMSALIDNLGW
jgi:hydroxyethylthiazole kinase-like uncharacterized protein yjeF